MLPSAQPRVVLALAALLAGCGDEPLPSFVLPVDPSWHLSVEGSARLVVAAGDGRVLLDGLPPGAVDADAPPLVGFAVRALTTGYEMQFGAFKPTDTAGGPWRVATRLTAAAESGTDLELYDQAGARLATLRFGSTRPGQLDVETLPGTGLERRLSWGFRCDAADHFAGFGAQTWDVDHRGYTVPTLVQENGIGKAETDEYVGAWFAQGRRHSSYLPMPEYLARRGYVLAVDTPYRAIFALCSERDAAARIEVEIGATMRLFDGPSPAEALTRASAALGRPRMPPRVAFAPWLDAIEGSEEVRRVAHKLRDEQVPSSVIWTEDWRGGSWSGESYELEEEWEVDRDLYPDFELVADELHALGFGWHVYFNPFVYVGSKAWDEVQPKGWLVQRPEGGDYVFAGAKLSDTGLLDLFDPDARAWAVEKMQAAIALGADGWMNDYAEWLPTDAVTAGGSGAELHNRYPVAWQEVAREAIDGAGDGVERLFFGRSGWLGTPPLADVIWAGDQRTSFDQDDGLPTIIPIGVGLGLVGVSTYGHDIAGYQSATNPGSTRELFFRWTALGAWSPVMRTHHGYQPGKNWSWEKDAETLALFRRYAALHISLLPWLEGLGREAADTGVPIWRGLFVHFPEDAACWPITDEVMVGPSVLVAPVLEAGASARSVYLPAGRWYPFGGGSAIEGGRSVEVDAPLEEIPVLVRAGGIVVRYPDGVVTVLDNASEVPGPASVGDDRVLDVFLGADGAFVEADGALRYRLTTLAGDDGSGTLALSWQDQLVTSCAKPAVAPCAAGDTIHLSGPGMLTIDRGGDALAELEIEGGASDRLVTVVLHR